MYSAAFGVSIMAMTMITTLIILAVTSNLVLSLGMGRRVIHCSFSNGH